MGLIRISMNSTLNQGFLNDGSAIGSLSSSTSDQRAIADESTFINPKPNPSKWECAATSNEESPPKVEYFAKPVALTVAPWKGPEMINCPWDSRSDSALLYRSPGGAASLKTDLGNLSQEQPPCPSPASCTFSSGLLGTVSSTPVWDKQNAADSFHQSTDIPIDLSSILEPAVTLEEMCGPVVTDSIEPS